MSNTQDCFEQLPDEILIRILNKIDTCSLKNFCTAFPRYEYMYRDRNVTKHLNFSNFNSNNFQIASFIRQNINLEFVTSLNVNGLYWLPVTDLRKIVEKLKNLTSLFAIDTKLSLKKIDIKLYYGTKINILAINGDNFEVQELQLPVKTLYLKISQNNFLFHFMHFHNLFPELEKLWIDSFLTSSIEQKQFLQSYLIGRLENKLSRLIYSTYCTSLNLSPEADYIICFKSRAGSEPFYICYEHFNDMSKLNLDKSTYLNSIKDEMLKKAWKDLEQLHYYPCGPLDARKLLVQEVDMGNIHFEELSFTHESTFCIDKLYNAAKTILNSYQGRNLKRLCINDCLLQNKLKDEKFNLQNDSILKNMPNLEELEVFYCNSVRRVTIARACLQISCLKNLAKLTFMIPVFSDGSFLIQILKNCEHLTSLRIKSLAQNENLNFNLSKAIPYGLALKDFSFENYRIAMNTLLNSLCCIKTSKLERIYLKCENVNQFTATPLKSFLDKNPNLVFLYIIIENLTSTSIRQIQQMLNSYSKNSKAKFFHVQKKCFGRENPMPNIYYDEMVRMHSRVVSINFKRDFYLF